jgi:hypothetical protein
MRNVLLLPVRLASLLVVMIDVPLLPVRLASLLVVMIDFPLLHSLGFPAGGDTPLTKGKIGAGRVGGEGLH